MLADAMDLELDDVELRRIDPARNMWRFYGMTECATLFGELCLRIVWGRLGNRRLRERSEVFPDRAALARRRAELLSLRRRHGYVASSTPRAAARTRAQERAADPAIVPPAPQPVHVEPVTSRPEGATPAETKDAVDVVAVQTSGDPLRVRLEGSSTITVQAGPRPLLRLRVGTAAALAAAIGTAIERARVVRSGDRTN